MTVSRNLGPNTISAGDMMQSGTGVFRNCNTARINVSVFRVPDGPMLSNSSRSAAFTATFARPFDRGAESRLTTCSAELPSVLRMPVSLMP